MKILLINPNSDTNTEEILREKSNFFETRDIVIHATSVKNAPLLVSTKLHWAQALPEMMNIVQEDQYDAYVVACHGDPNLDLLKEITKKPVVGIAEASMIFASLEGNGFAVISPSEKSVSNKRALTRKYHCDQLFVTTEVPADDTYEELYKACKRATETKGVDAIVLGCANYAMSDASLEKQLSIPVLDGVSCAIVMAIGLVLYQKQKEQMKGERDVR